MKLFTVSSKIRDRCLFKILCLTRAWFSFSSVRNFAPPIAERINNLCKCYGHSGPAAVTSKMAQSFLNSAALGFVHLIFCS